MQVASLQLVYGKFRNRLIYLKSDDLDLQHCCIPQDGNLNKPQKSRHIRSDDNLHNLLLNVNLLMENLMLRD